MGEADHIVTELSLIKTCPVCGTAIMRGKAGRPAKYCSQNCKSKADRDACKEKRHARMRSEVTECPCGARWTALPGSGNAGRQFCSTECRLAAKRVHYLTRDCEHCLNSYNPKRVDQRFCNKSCANAFRAQLKGMNSTNGWLARARYYGVDYDAGITRPRVAKRDGWACGLCPRDIDPELSYPDPLSQSLDHVIPLSAGGGHVWSNVQLAHLVCNMRKGGTAGVSDQASRSEAA